MIVDEKPIPDVSSTSINWDWKSFQPIDDRQRDELLRKLVRTEIVRAVADNCRQAISFMPSAYQMIGARLACRVRRIGLVGRTLAKRTGLPQGSINLIGRNMVETKLLFDLPERARASNSTRPSGGWLFQGRWSARKEVDRRSNDPRAFPPQYAARLSAHMS